MAVEKANLRHYKKHLRQFKQKDELKELKSLSEDKQQLLANLWAKTHNGNSHGVSVFTFNDNGSVLQTIDIDNDNIIDATNKHYEFYKSDKIGPNSNYFKIETKSEYKNIKEFMNSIGLSTNKRNSKAAVNQAIANLGEQRGLDNIKIGDKSYKLSAISNHNYLDYRESTDNMLIVATPNTNENSKIKGSHNDDIIIASDIEIIDGNNGDDTIFASGRGVYAFVHVQGDNGNDKITGFNITSAYGGKPCGNSGIDTLEGGTIFSREGFEVDNSKDLRKNLVEPPITKEEISQMPDVDLNKDYQSRNELYQALGLSNKKFQTHRNINKAIAKLESQGAKEITLKGITYQLGLHADTDFIDYKSSDKPMLILATAEHYEIGRLDASNKNDIVIANSYQNVYGNGGDDFIETNNVMAVSGDGDAFNGKYGDDTIIAAGATTIDGGDGIDVASGNYIGSIENCKRMY